MGYTIENVMNYISEEDVKFIRLVFSDAFGKVKNISIMPNELEAVFNYGYTIDASKVMVGVKKKIVLWPDPNTISVLPWRPSAGKVIRMMCDIKNQDGTTFELDARNVLKNAIKLLDSKKASIFFRTEFDFYLFKLDEEGENTLIPYDKAGYMDVAPVDKGENIRREICLSLNEMNIPTCGSYHEAGPGQNKICISNDTPLEAAEKSITFTALVKTIASRNGLYADFSHLPIPDKPVSKHKIIISADPETMELAKKNLKKHYDEMYLFINNTNNLYRDYDQDTDITFDEYLNEIYIERVSYGYNPYLVYALIIYAIFDESNDNDTQALTLSMANEIVKNSKFIKKYLNEDFINEYVF